MALEGSIKEFGLADILQLIGLQKKSGILTIHHKEISATINICKGQIIYADSSKREEPEKIGRLLLSAGKLTEKDIDEALSIQSRTGEKIGHILVTSGFISKEDLKDALEIQIKDVIFQALLWKEGWYRFDVQDSEYEKDYQIAVQTDFILMEGIRMLDEWPYIEDIIPSDSIIFSQSFKSNETETLFSSLSTNELTVFNLINGQRDIKDIVALTQFSEFEVYKTLATLKVSGLISHTASSKEEEETIIGDKHEKRRLWTVVQIAFLAFTFSFVLIFLPVKEMMGINEIFTISTMFKERAVKNRLLYVHKAIRYYYLINGEVPDSLQLLYKEQYIPKRFITNPWGNPFVYEKLNPSTTPFKNGELKSGYRLYSKGVDSIIDTQDDIY